MLAPISLVAPAPISKDGSGSQMPLRAITDTVSRNDPETFSTPRFQ